MAELVDDMSSQPQKQTESREPENSFPHACYKIDKGSELMKDYMWEEHTITTDPQ